MTNQGHFQSHYIPNTPEEQEAMLATLNLHSVDELFQDIPDTFRNPVLNLPSPISEIEIQKELSTFASNNRVLSSGPSFLGAGSYNHFIPAIVKSLMTRGEFLTAYTPYQPEVSQGTLQVIYEFQSLIANLYDMEVANAGMYDGATSLAEGVLMACRVTKRAEVIILDSVSPLYQQVIHTYCQAQGINITTDSASNLSPSEKTACVVSQYPNFIGGIEDIAGHSAKAHNCGGLLVVSTNPLAMGMLKSPGEYGADIVTGEGQPLGIPTSYGGPYLGLFATKQEYIRQMPSRIVGRTVDTNGKNGYVLTLQTREQHIRRERATSNICTNEALYALASTIYLSAMGKHGLRQISELCYHKAHYAANEISKISGYKIVAPNPFFHEFIIECPVPAADVNRMLMSQNILGGLDLSNPPFSKSSPGNVVNGMLMCVTELNSRQDIDSLISALREIK